MVKQTGSIRFDVEDLKNIPICDLFYNVALDTIEPLLKTKNGNIMVANGQLNLIIFAKCTIYTINTLRHNGCSAMVWLRG